VAYPYPHAIQLPEVAANVPRQHKVLSPLHQRALLRPRGHEATTNVRGAPSVAVSEHWAAPPRKSYWSLTEDDRASRLGQPRLMAHSRRANARTLLAHLLHLHLSRVLGHHFLAHATAVQPPSHESVVLSAPAPVCRIQPQIQVQVQATVGVRDTIPMS